MPHLPVFLELAGRECLVVGGGPVAARRVRALLDCGARVSVVSPTRSAALTAVIDAAVRRGADITVSARRYVAADVTGAHLVFACTDDVDVQATIVADAHAAGALVARADRRDGADFAAAAHFRRGPLCVAVGTSGAGPGLSSLLLSRLEGVVGSHYGVAARVLEEVRGRLPKVGVAGERRSVLMIRLLDEGLLEMLAERRLDDAGELVRAVTGISLGVQWLTLEAARIGAGPSGGDGEV